MAFHHLRVASRQVLTPERTLTLLIAGMAAGAIAVATGPSPAQPDLAGLARVIDGDTLTVAGTRIRLYGIDAPETAQTCTRRTGTWSCGLAASAALSDLVRGRVVRCRPRGLDIYGRTLARCFANDRDIGAQMVRQGVARAFYRYSWSYVLEEALARVQGVGVWQGDFQSPWEYRRTSADRRPRNP
jgi:endonuclease YncB( thermonuclease family)